MSKKGIYFITILISIMMVLTVLLQLNVYAYTPVFAPAKSMVVIEGNTNTVLYEFKKDIKLPMASVTKIITAIVAIENTKDINEIVDIHKNAVGIEGTSIYLKESEKLSMYDLLLGLILASGNDASVAIAEHIGKEKGEKGFIEEMNDFAKRIGCKNTNFDNPHGLDSKTHYTTAYDLAIITSYALKNETFREISKTKYATINGNGISQERYLKNKNKLLFSMDCCIGVKTGFTDNAGRCLVNACEKDGMQIISVVLNCGPMFEECKRLTEQAHREYAIKEFVEPYSFVTNITVNNSDKNTVGVATIKGCKLVIKKQEINQYKVEYDIPSTLEAPVEINKPIGKVKVSYKEKEIFSEELYAIENAKNIDLKYLIENILNKWISN